MKPSILHQIVSNLPDVKDSPVAKIIQGDCMCAVQGNRTGLASRSNGLFEISPPQDKTVMELIRLFIDTPTAPSPAFDPSWCMGSINSLLPPPDNAIDFKAQDLILKKGEGKRVVVIGHFPFVERMGDRFASFDVLELSPKPGDVPAAKAPELLPQADVIALTGTTFLNNTLDALVDLCPKNAFLMMLGPTTPFSPVLFDAGFDVLCGSEVVDEATALQGIAQGLPFKKLQGVRYRMVLREKNL
ncbi:Rossmann-like domain-containing protein [Desulfovibrio inopinatus]|uniref:Rossmann-like domain-containing protein n=1 Tax=Desulfovibrio inopinatus TaxID=102109 RepID=UPI0004091052|nr:DUF364 domain-containing protein [Desulfovibrio inopinatus]